MKKYSIKNEPGRVFNNNSFYEIKSIKKNNESGIKNQTPKDNDEKIQIKKEKRLNSLKIPLRDDKKSISTNSSRFSIVGNNIDNITKSIRDQYGDKSRKESITEKELKMINIELNKSKFGNEKYNYLSNRISPKKTELEKYKRENEKNKNRNNYFLIKQQSKDNVLQNINNKNLNKTQYLKKTLENSKPITTKNIMAKSTLDEFDSTIPILKPNISESNFNIKRRDEKTESILNRFNISQDGRKDKKDYYLTKNKEELKQIFSAKVNIESRNAKKEGIKRNLGETNNIGINYLAKNRLNNSKSEDSFIGRQRFNTYNSRKHLDNSVGNIVNIGNIGNLKEKERREREKLQIEKEMERMGKMERERQRKERQIKKEKERLEREEKEKKRIEEMEKEKKEKEKREREKQEKKEKEKKEREQKEKERKEKYEKEKKEKQEKKERERLEKER